MFTNKRTAMQLDPIDKALMNSDSIDAIGLLTHNTNIHTVRLIKFPSDPVLLQLINADQSIVHNVHWRVFDYLFQVRDSGRINMALADKVLVHRFGMDKRQAMTIVRIWMEQCKQLERYVVGRILSEKLPDVICYDIDELAYETHPSTL